MWLLLLLFLFLFVLLTDLGLLDVLDQVKCQLLLKKLADLVAQALALEDELQKFYLSLHYSTIAKR